MIKKQLLTAVATIAFLGNALTGFAAASTGVEIAGNGSHSDNSVTATTTTDNTLVQTNTANVNNNVQSNSDTGHNSANDNTGGSVLIGTGNASNSVDVQTRVNGNIASLQNCGCTTGTTSVLEAGNGSFSDNAAHVTNNNTSQLFQTNNAQITNDIVSRAETGRNEVNGTTGGDSTIVTGHAMNDVSVGNMANGNVASMGSGSGTGGSGLSAIINGNGSHSDNSIDLSAQRSSSIVQNNDAQIRNHIDSNADTGYNSANDNTGGIFGNSGNTTIDTGNATNGVRVNNLANFNAADAGCGCDMTFLGKIVGNGSFSDSNLSSELNNTQSAFQTGIADLSNNIQAHQDTGFNSINGGTNFLGGLLDPAIITGHSANNTTVGNTGNANVSGSTITLPGNLHLNLMFNMQDLLGQLSNLNLG